MDEKQILLVKLSWSNVYRRPEAVQGTFEKKLNSVSPILGQICKRQQLYSGFVSTINLIVVNLHSVSEIRKELDNAISKYCQSGFDGGAFNSMVIAFLLSMEKLLGVGWNAETQNAWVMAIATVSHRYNEAHRRLQKTDPIL